MALSINVSSSDWIDLRTRGYNSGMYLLNAVGAAIEYSTAATPVPGTTLVGSSAVLISGTYLWMRGSGDCELYTASEWAAANVKTEPLLVSTTPDGVGGSFDESGQKALRATGVAPRAYPNRNVVSRAVVVDDMTSGATRWAGGRVGCTMTDDAASARLDLGAKSALNVAVTASFCRFYRAFSSAATFTGPIAIWVELDWSPTSGMLFYFTSDAANTFTKNVKYVVPFNGLRKGMNCLLFHPQEDGTTTNKTITVTGADSLTNPVTAIRLEVNNWEGHTFKIHGVYHNGKARPQVIMNWDDGDASHWQLFNIFRQRNIPGTLSLITSRLKNGSPAYLTDAQLDTIYQYGWDYLPHSVSHPAGGMAVLSEAEARYELTESRRKLLEWGYSRAADIFTWPENAYDSNNPSIDLIAMAKQCGYVATRGSKGSFLATAQGIDQPMRLPSVDLGGRTLAQAKKYIDAAILYGQTVILYGHVATGTEIAPPAGGTPPGVATQWYLSDYIALADYIADKVEAGQLDAITYSDLRAQHRF